MSGLILLTEYVEQHAIQLVGDAYTGGMTLTVNGLRRDLGRHQAVDLVEKLTRHLEVAGQEKCVRDDCGHPMNFHGIGTRPGRPSPCLSCLCPAFR